MGAAHVVLKCPVWLQRLQCTTRLTRPRSSARTLFFLGLPGGLSDLGGLITISIALAALASPSDNSFHRDLSGIGCMVCEYVFRYVATVKQLSVNLCTFCLQERSAATACAQGKP
ncbi:hypothetical protein V8G54_028569 [Vigna mungo]|uniref:Uncharacterized protein n=1 Tax=Vigna mungo TaxID=3915 RepID=A0AAQ3RKZ2_VIGMU